MSNTDEPGAGATGGRRRRPTTAGTVTAADAGAKATPPMDAVSGGSSGSTSGGGLGGGSSAALAGSPSPYTSGTGGSLSTRSGGSSNPHFHYSLISWGSVFAGAVIAVVVGAMLNLLGLAIGVTAMEPGDPSGAGAGDLTVLGGLWLALSTLIGLLVGGWVAARASANPDHHEGALHGAAVWAVSFLLALFLTGSFVSGTAFNAMQAAGNAAESVQDSGGALDAARGAASGARDETAADTPDERRTEEAADRAADAAAGTAFWAFITMLASLVSAMIGGGLGARHPDHHVRPRRDYPSVI